MTTTNGHDHGHWEATPVNVTPGARYWRRRVVCDVGHSPVVQNGRVDYRLVGPFEVVGLSRRLDCLDQDVVVVRGPDGELLHANLATFRGQFELVSSPPPPPAVERVAGYRAEDWRSEGVVEP